MSSRSLSNVVVSRPPLVRASDTLHAAVNALLDSGLAALPVVDDAGRYRGIFGEREFMGALFPRYVDQLSGAAFLTSSIDAALERRDCGNERVADHMNTEHVEVGADHSDTQLAEIFLHHRVLIVPIVVDGEVRGLIPRREFFRAVAERFVGRESV